MFRRSCLALTMLVSLAGAAPAAHAESVVTVAMTAGDLPITTGTPDQGFEGFRFVGFNLYDALVGWDLSRGDKASEIVPGLATSWNIDPNNNKRWIFHLRKGVKWHAGCDFTADDVVWNFQRLAASAAAKEAACAASPSKRRVPALGTPTRKAGGGSASEGVGHGRA